MTSCFRFIGILVVVFIDNMVLFTLCAYVHEFLP